MSLFITSLNSGSNGNCYYIGNQSEAVLIDAGISCREIEKRMKRLGLSMDNVKAVFVSHEHSDHIRGINSLSKKYRLPIYITDLTCKHGGFDARYHVMLPFIAHEPVIINGLTVTAFPKLHDACDPFSFIVECNGVKAGIFTDIGFPCAHVIKYFKQCHAAFLEANYDEQMLEQGNYPYHLKKRIRGGRGHLSNKQAVELFTDHKPSFMSHLFLSHLSKNNNCPVLAADLFNKHAKGVKVIVASRYEETAVYHISIPGNQKAITVPRNVTQTQLQFSFA